MSACSVPAEPARDREHAVPDEATTALQNEEIAASGDVDASLPKFEHDKYVPVSKRPKIDEDLKGARMAKLMDDNSWKLGRIKDVLVTESHKIDGVTSVKKKYKFKWKPSNGGNVLTGMKLRKAEYGVHWVIFELPPRASSD